MCRSCPCTIAACMLEQDAAARKQRLKRFGHAVSERADDSVTVRGTEDIPFDRVQKARQTTEEKRAEKEDLRSALQGSDKSAVVGRWVLQLAHLEHLQEHWPMWRLLHEIVKPTLSGPDSCCKRL
jgi:hypothetical protein